MRLKKQDVKVTGVGSLVFIKEGNNARKSVYLSSFLEDEKIYLSNKKEADEDVCQKDFLRVTKTGLR